MPRSAWHGSQMRAKRHARHTAAEMVKSGKDVTGQPTLFASLLRSTMVFESRQLTRMLATSGAAGRLEKADGSTYEGEFREDAPAGRGVREREPAGRGVRERR